MLTDEVAKADVVITTALIPGRKAPVLIPEAMVAGMKRGSVIVDMASVNGGNVIGTVDGEKVVTKLQRLSHATCRRSRDRVDGATVAWHRVDAIGAKFKLRN